MSHAMGAVRFPDGQIFYFDYNGTSDVCTPKLYPDQPSVVWRSDGWPECKCEKPAIQIVQILSDYGGGFYWDGKACRQCLTLTEGFNPDDFDVVHSHPKWSPFKSTSPDQNAEVKP